jgi:hypothetical protein
MDYVKKGSKERGDVRIVSSDARNKYIRRLAMELINRIPAENYVSDPMDHGIAFEGHARRAYAARYDCMIDKTGFVLHPTLDLMGASPDGLAIPKGAEAPTHVTEFKCPSYDTYLKYMDTGILEEKYVLQVQCERLCCELTYGDLVAFYAPDPNLAMPYIPERFRMITRRIEIDSKVDRKMEEAAIQAMKEATDKVAEWMEKFPEIAGEQPPDDEAPPADLNDYAGPAYDFLDAADLTP